MWTPIQWLLYINAHWLNTLLLCTRTWQDGRCEDLPSSTSLQLFGRKEECESADMMSEFVLSLTISLKDATQSEGRSYQSETKYRRLRFMCYAFTHPAWVVENTPRKRVASHYWWNIQHTHTKWFGSLVYDSHVGLCKYYEMKNKFSSWVYNFLSFIFNLLITQHLCIVLLNLLNLPIFASGL